jgi:predicted nuclease of predicted toxin-antitoxin system
MKIVADESVDFGIILALRNIGITVISILEVHSGIMDEQVLSIAIENDSLLITEDKDFGELTYRQKYVHKGILLTRVNDLPRMERIEFVVKIIEEYYFELLDNFAVLDKKGLRIKKSRHI